MTTRPTLSIGYSMSDEIRASSRPEKLNSLAGSNPKFASGIVTAIMAAVAMLGPMTSRMYADPTGERLPTLTRVDEVRRLTREQAQRAYPVRLRGVVTYFSVLPSDVGGIDADLFVQDATGGMWVRWTPDL